MTESADGGAKVFSQAFLDGLSVRAGASPRRRQSHNIHRDFSDPCQRFFNAMEPGSYLRPHRQLVVPRDKLVVAVRGRFALVVFDEEGELADVIGFGVGPEAAACGAEVPAGRWNSIVSLEPGSVLLEVKAGPFDPDGPREPAPWAPAEGSAEAPAYLAELVRRVALIDGQPRHP